MGDLEKTSLIYKNRFIWIKHQNSRTYSYLSGVRSDLVVEASDKGWVKTGHLKAGLNFNGSYKSKSWSVSIYGMQGINGMVDCLAIGSLQILGIVFK